MKNRILTFQFENDSKYMHSLHYICVSVFTKRNDLARFKNEIKQTHEFS
jgi:hypothetical protein